MHKFFVVERAFVSPRLVKNDDRSMFYWRPKIFNSFSRQFFGRYQTVPDDHNFVTPNAGVGVEGPLGGGPLKTYLNKQVATITLLCVSVVPQLWHLIKFLKNLIISYVIKYFLFIFSSVY
jgi:hypothetical protein